MSTATEVLNAHTDLEGWLERRRGLMTASVAAVPFGDHPWVTPEQLQKRKLGLLPPQEETEAMYRGKLFEPAAIEHFRQETGRPVLEAGLRAHPYHPLIGATPDGWLPAHGDAPASVLECKVPQWPELSKIRRRGLRTYIVYQCQIEAYVFNVEYVSCEVLDTGSPRSSMIFDVEADPEFQAELVGRLEQWWERHIVNREPVKLAAPPEDLPEVKGEIVRVQDAEFDRAVRDYLLARDVASEAETVKKDARGHIRAYLEAAGHGVYEGEIGRVHYQRRAGRSKHAQTVKAIKGVRPLDPVKTQAALTEHLTRFPGIGARDVERALAEAADDCRLDIEQFEGRGSSYDQIDVYRVRREDGA